MNILITGGAGYIGSHTALELVKVGHSVICIDNGCNAYVAGKGEHPESLKRVQEITGKKIAYYDVDIRDKTALNCVFKKVSVYSIKNNLNNWNRRRCWEVGSFDSEAIFVCDISHIDEFSVRQIVSISSALYQNVGSSFLVWHQ